MTGKDLIKKIKELGSEKEVVIKDESLRIFIRDTDVKEENGRIIISR